MQYYVANPDRYGRFGHQSFSMLTAWAIAAMLDQRFIPLPYLYFAINYNKYINFGNSRFSKSTSLPQCCVYHLDGNQSIDKAGNNRLDLSTAQGINTLLVQLSNLQELEAKSEANSIIFLPFDQDLGLLGKLIKANKSDIERIFHFNGLIQKILKITFKP